MLSNVSDIRGHSDGRTLTREDIIRTWMTTVLRDGGIERFDDLHIDRIDSVWKERDRWVDGGLQALRLAMSLRDEAHLPADVALAFSLESGKDSRGADFKDTGGLKAQFDWVPPSLYLVHPGRMPWERPAAEGRREAKVSVRKMAPALLGFDGPAKGCWYIEFKQPDSAEYARTIFLIG